MKNFFFLLILLILPYIAFTQKNDYWWALGHNGGTLINFHETPPLIAFRNSEIDIGSVNASISNSEGTLLFYTNGCRIFNSANEIMENGDNINPGLIHNEQCPEPFATYIGIRNAIILPQPDSENIFFLFHIAISKHFEPFTDIYAYKLYFSKVDISQNGGLGKVIEKNGSI